MYIYIYIYIHTHRERERERERGREREKEREREMGGQVFKGIGSHDSRISKFKICQHRLGAWRTSKELMF